MPSYLLVVVFTVAFLLPSVVAGIAYVHASRHGMTWEQGLFYLAMWLLAGSAFDHLARANSMSVDVSWIYWLGGHLVSMTVLIAAVSCICFLLNPPGENTTNIKVGSIG